MLTKTSQVTMTLVRVCVAALAFVSLKVSASEIGEYSAFEKDFFTEHFQTHINYSIDPCDNFYRHVCSRTKMHDPLSYIDQMAKEISAKELEEDPKRMQLLSFCEEHKERNVGSPCARLLLRNKSVHIRKYLHEHEYDTAESLAKFVAFADEIKSKVREQIEKEFQFSASTRKELLALINRTKINEFSYFNTSVEEFESSYDKLFETALAMEPNQLLEFAPRDDVLDIPLIDAFYLFDTGDVYIMDGIAMLLLKADEYVKTSVFAQVLAHELHHSVLARQYGREDVLYQRKLECIKNYTAHACGVFDEETKTCGGGEETLREDAPDYEAMQASYLIYTDNFGDRLDEKYLSDITYKQLFFYSQAATVCLDSELRAGHAASFLRINGVFALADSFHEAFQCKEDSRMAKLAAAAGPDKCNFFGDTVRR